MWYTGTVLIGMFYKDNYFDLISEAIAIRLNCRVGCNFSMVTMISVSHWTFICIVFLCKFLPPCSLLWKSIMGKFEILSWIPSISEIYRDANIYFLCAMSPHCHHHQPAVWWKCIPLSCVHCFSFLVYWEKKCHLWSTGFHTTLVSSKCIGIFLLLQYFVRNWTSIHQIGLWLCS